MKITNPNFTLESVQMAYRQIMQLLSYGASQPAPFTARNPKLSMDVTIACQEQAQLLFANLFIVEVEKITFMERVFPGPKVEIQQLGLPRPTEPWVRIHEFDIDAGFRVWDWRMAMADPQLISCTPVAKFQEGQS